MYGLLLGAFAWLIGGCAENEVVLIVQDPAWTGEFSNEIRPILEGNCGGTMCHSGGPQGFASGLDLTSHEAIFRGSRYGAVVIPGHPYMSHLLQTINHVDTTLSPISSVTMPASRDPVPWSDVLKIAAWIRDGGRDDYGSIPFPEPRPLGKAFFTSQAVDLVGIIDLQTHLVMRYVTVGNSLPLTTPQAPHNVQIDDQGRYYYVTLISAGKLKKYDAVTNALLGEADVGLQPAHVVVTQDGSKAYVTDFNQSVGRVFVVNTASMTVENVIAASTLFMKATHGARLSHDGRFLYVGNNGTDLMTVIATTNDSIVAHIPVSNDVPPVGGSFVYRPYQIAVRSDDRYIYVTANGRDMVNVIERDSGDVFVWRKNIPVGIRPLQCELTPDGRFLYVCNRGSETVSVISTDSNAVYATVQNVGKQPHGIDITEDGRTAYVTCENLVDAEPPHHPVSGSGHPGFVAVIDIPTNRVIRRIEVGGFAAGMSVFPGKGN